MCSHLMAENTKYANQANIEEEIIINFARLDGVICFKFGV